MKFNEGDLFRWSFKKPSDHMPYHCCSQIAEFQDGMLRDTFWGLGFGSNGRKWTPEQALERLNLTFLANRADLIPSTSAAYKKYRHEDLVDLRHSNTSLETVYIKRGAEPSPEVMAEHLRYVIERSESEMRMAGNRIERASEQLRQIEAGELPEYLECDAW